MSIDFNRVVFLVGELFFHLIMNDRWIDRMERGGEEDERQRRRHATTAERSEAQYGSWWGG